MKRFLIGTVVGATLMITAYVSAQQTQQAQHLDGNHIIITPEMKAQLDETDNLVAQASDYLRRGDYGQAENSARQGTYIQGGGGQAQELLATALDAEGKTEEALSAYKVIADEGGVFPRNMLPYALLLLKTGHWAKAVEVYNKQLPYLAEGHLMEAQSHFSTRDYQPTDLATALHIALGLTGDWHGYQGTRQEEQEQMLNQFKQANNLEPDCSLAHFYYGFSLQRMGHRAEAKEAFKKAADMDQNGDVKAAAKKAMAVN